MTILGHPCGAAGCRRCGTMADPGCPAGVCVRTTPWCSSAHQSQDTWPEAVCTGSTGVIVLQ
eukprot:9430195-Karenia_brevis.AAC.1